MSAAISVRKQRDHKERTVGPLLLTPFLSAQPTWPPPSPRKQNWSPPAARHQPDPPTGELPVLPASLPRRDSGARRPRSAIASRLLNWGRKPGKPQSQTHPTSTPQDSGERGFGGPRHGLGRHTRLRTCNAGDPAPRRKSLRAGRRHTIPEVKDVSRSGKAGPDVVWKTDFDITAATPIYAGGCLSCPPTTAATAFCCGSSRRGGPDVVWKSRVMPNHFATSVLHRGHLYGFNATPVCGVPNRQGEMGPGRTRAKAHY